MRSCAFCACAGRGRAEKLTDWHVMALGIPAIKYYIFSILNIPSRLS